MRSIKIVLTGPESTGKSELTLELAKHFNGIAVEEFARSYILNLNRPYNFSDVEAIGKQQLNDFQRITKEHTDKIIFFDTFLIITKVWFEVVYKKVPDWIDNELRSVDIDLFLLCAPDLPWEKDNVRENGGEMRDWLFREYEKNLIKYNFAYKIVEGFGNARVNCAINHINSFLQARANE